MNNSGTKIKVEVQEQRISKIIQETLIDLYGVNGYKSILKTIIEKSKKSEKEITGNFELFSKLIQETFGDMGVDKMLEPINHELIEKEIKYVDTNQPSPDKSKRILIADDEPNILKLYQAWLKFENNHIITVENGKKCLSTYEKEFRHNSENCFDVVILDQKMPIMTGIQTAKEILKINPKQRIIFASGNLREVLSESRRELGKKVEVIQKPFSTDELNDMINQTTIIEKSEMVGKDQEKTRLEKVTDTNVILKNQNC